MGADERNATLKRFSESGELDVRGVTISDALFGEIFDAAPHDANGHLVFSSARFGGATFKGDAGFGEATFEGGETDFGEATFEGEADFVGVTIRGDARFDKVTFKGDTWFCEATFGLVAHFDKATFKNVAGFDAATFGAAWFDKATFKGAARFGGATFGAAGFGDATFERGADFGDATFERRADFGRATFKGAAGFGEATIKGDARFDKATFEGDARFGGATFKGDARFGGATFKGAARFGGATFKGGAAFVVVTIEGDARFDKATFEGDARFGEATIKGDARFDKATFRGDVPVLGPIVVGGSLNLNEVQFASMVRIEADASVLTCRWGRFPGGVRFNVRHALVRLDDLDLSAPSLLTVASGPAGITDQPRLLSLQQANVAGLVLGNVDLTDCRFAGAHNLDKLRLEAGTSFGLSPAVAGWERRQVIAEEAAWRAARVRPGRWKAPMWPDSEESGPEVLSPGAIAGLYRALRKGREDTKDEPGAADFYYGEMEMRRHDRNVGDAEWWRGREPLREVLTAYWLVSGYGQRAWRSLAALAAVTALFAVAFHFIGFTTPPEPASYWTSLLYAFRSTISLTDSQVTLTAWGSFFQALLRITGPVLLGLTLLALRGRVKR